MFKTKLVSHLKLLPDAAHPAPDFPEFLKPFSEPLFHVAIPDVPRCATNGCAPARRKRGRAS